MKRNIVFLLTLLIGVLSHPQFALSQLSQVDRQLLMDINLVENGGFENGTAKWTNAGSGTFAKTTTAANVAVGTTAGSWDAAAAEDTLTGNPQTVPAGLFGQECQASVRIKGGDTSLTLQVVDGTVTVLGSLKLTSNVGFVKEVVDFTCPASGTVAIRLHSSGDAAIAYVDQFSLGLKDAVQSRATNEPNAIKNPFAERNINGYSATGAVTVTRLATTGPLSPMIPSGFRLDAGAAEDYAHHCFQIPTNYKNRKMKLQWEQTPEASAPSGEWRVEVWKSANADCSSATEAGIGTDDTSGVSLISAFSGRFTTAFDTDSNSYYQIRWVRVTGTNHFDITELIVGPGSMPVGYPHSQRVDYTASAPAPGDDGSGSGTWNYYYYWRAGEHMHIRAKFTYGVAGTGSATVDFALPPGFTYDNTEEDTIGDCNTYGVESASASFTNSCFLSSIDEVNIRNAAQSTNYVGSDFPLNSRVNLNLKVRVNEWIGSSSVNLGRNTPLFAADDGSTDIFGPNGALVPNQAVGTAVDRVITFSSPQESDDWVVEYMDGSWPQRWTKVADIFPRDVQGAKEFGIYTFWSSATALTVRFADGGTVGNNATYAGNSSVSWATKFSDGDRFRVRRTTPGEAVGFGLATATSSGLISSTTQTIAGGKTLDGTVDEPQLTVQGHSTQTTNVVLVEDSAGTDLMSVSNTGDIVNAGNVTATGGVTGANFFIGGGGTGVGKNNFAVLKFLTETGTAACDTVCNAAGNCSCLVAHRMGGDTQDTCASTSTTDRACFCVCDDF